MSPQPSHRYPARADAAAQGYRWTWDCNSRAIGPLRAGPSVKWLALFHLGGMSGAEAAVADQSAARLQGVVAAGQAAGYPAFAARWKPGRAGPDRPLIGGLEAVAGRRSQIGFRRLIRRDRRRLQGVHVKAGQHARIAQLPLRRSVHRIFRFIGEDERSLAGSRHMNAPWLFDQRFSPVPFPNR